ncbi:MAG: stage II sporulation protein P [Firmicutes bacterium]|nr:stage II sporulation protein P [Bacillota bacterium]
MRKIIVYILLIYIISLSFSLSTAYSLNRFHNLTSYSGHQAGRCNVIQDQQGNVITELSRNVYVGDEIILPNGNHYRVTITHEHGATAKHIGKDRDYMRWVQYFKRLSVQTVTNEWKNRPVGIYHTHTDESYQPTSGKAIEPFEGDIYQVGQQFANTMRDKGIDVIYYKTPHDPHDNNAYVRSRRTATGIIKNNPVAVFDIHRDGVLNPNKYRAKINGQWVAQVRIVVGKQNPRRITNQDFAKRLMAQASQIHPGLIKDLYIGSGNYNQDLLTTAILLEAGTHTNSLEEAKRGITLFTDAVPAVLGLTRGGGDGPGGSAIGQLNEHNNSAWAAAGWLLLITLVGVGAFYFINSGNFEEAIGNTAVMLKKKMSSPEVNRVKEKFVALTVAVKNNLISIVYQFIRSPQVKNLVGRISAFISRIAVRISRGAIAKPVRNKKRKGDNE